MGPGPPRTRGRPSSLRFCAGRGQNPRRSSVSESQLGRSSGSLHGVGAGSGQVGRANVSEQSPLPLDSSRAPGIPPDSGLSQPSDDFQLGVRILPHPHPPLSRQVGYTRRGKPPTPAHPDCRPHSHSVALSRPHQKHQVPLQGFGTGCPLCLGHPSCGVHKARPSTPPAAFSETPPRPPCLK